MSVNDIEALKSNVGELFYFKRAWAFGIPIAILAYLTYVFISFDILGLSERGSLQNAKSLVGDMYSHKVHVTRDNRKGDISISIEGEKKGRYAFGEAPEWVELGSTSKVDLGNGHLIYFGEKDVVYEIPNYGRVWAEPGLRGVEAEYPDGPLPEWINQSKNRVTITTDAGRLTITRNRTEVFRYFYGWELFFFTLDSQYHGKSISELASLAFNGELPKIMRDFWYNKMWRHSDVAWAIGETILMAFLGTFGAALVAFPLAFLAAKNITPLQPVRFFFRRIFDFTRGLDHLLWTIILARAFGPGPLTGALAMVVTDTGTFGKLFSVTTFGESHGPVLGCVVDGCPPGLELDATDLQADLDRRKPGKSRYTTQRRELDEIKILSGTFEGKTTGTPIGMIIENVDQKPKDYTKIKELFRPSHADYTYFQNNVLGSYTFL